jgi:rhodanese-related sulfurtransferase
MDAGVTRLIDVRTPEERKFVGYVPDSVHVAWITGTSCVHNPHFVRELESKARKDEVLLFICRSGQRSAAAAATCAQFQNAFNVVEGFEGELDERKHRGGPIGDGELSAATRGHGHPRRRRSASLDVGG